MCVCVYIYIYIHSVSIPMKLWLKVQNVAIVDIHIESAPQTALSQAAKFDLWRILQEVNFLSRIEPKQTTFTASESKVSWWEVGGSWTISSRTSLFPARSAMALNSPALGVDFVPTGREKEGFLGFFESPIYGCFYPLVINESRSQPLLTVSREEIGLEAVTLYSFLTPT